MNMTKDAIQTIAELAIAASGNGMLFNREQLNEPILIGPRGEISRLEYYQAGRSRFRGAFFTNLMPEFVSYVLEHDEPGTQVFILPAKLSACAYFNIGTAKNPGHGDWTANYAPSQTAAYAAISLLNGKRVSQRDMIDFIEDWAPNFSGGADAEGIIPKQHVTTALRDVTVAVLNQTNNVESDLGAKKTAIESIEAKSTKRIPTLLHFDVIPYVGMQSRRVTLRLAYHKPDDPNKPPSLGVRIVAFEALAEELTNEFKTILQKNLGRTRVMIGSFNPIP